MGKHVFLHVKRIKFVRKTHLSYQTSKFFNFVPCGKTSVIDFEPFMFYYGSKTTMCKLQLILNCVIGCPLKLFVNKCSELFNKFRNEINYD